MAFDAVDIDASLTVTYTATILAAQVIPNIGYNLADEDIKVTGLTTALVETLIPASQWSMNAARNTLTLTHDTTTSYATVRIEVDPLIQQKLDYNRDSSSKPEDLEKQLDRIGTTLGWIRDCLDTVKTTQDSILVRLTILEAIHGLSTVGNIYYQPDGISTYLQPDGTSLYYYLT